MASLALAALGIVFGQLGTSPLYALPDAFNGACGVAATPENVVGTVSLFLWSLIAMVSVKYALVLMQAANCGEGGLLALLTPFAVEPFGSGKAGVAFGRILAISFVGIFILGVAPIAGTPSILAAFNPINDFTLANQPSCPSLLGMPKPEARATDMVARTPIVWVLSSIPTPSPHFALHSPQWGLSPHRPIPSHVRRLPSFRPLPGQHRRYRQLGDAAYP